MSGRNEFENYLSEGELAEWAREDPLGFALAYGLDAPPAAPIPSGAPDPSWLDWIDVLIGLGIFAASRGRTPLPFGVNPPKSLPRG